MTTPNSVTQSQTAAAMLRAGDETGMLCYALNQQAQTENRWPLPDGSCVILHLETGCYEFVSPDGSSELRHATTQPKLPYINSGHLLWRLLKEAASEAGASISEDDDPPLPDTEALSVCPELSDLIYDALDKFEPDDHTHSWLEHEAVYMAEDIRREITLDRWQAIVATTKKRLDETP